MRPFLAPACSLFLASSLLAQSVPQVDVQSMLQGLDQLKQKQQQTARAALNNTLSAFASAASTDQAAQDFYLQAVQVTQFSGQPHEQTNFQNWRKKEVGRMNPSAIRACLSYTVLSLRRAAGATDQQIFPAVLGYAQEAQQLLPTIGEDPIIHQSITGNVFAKWYNLSDQLNALENWSMEPGDIDGIYDKFLLPIMRKNRDPRILQYWDTKIAQETAAASTTTNTFSVDRFNQTRRPELLWSRAEDAIAIGARDQGLTTMYTIIKSFPDHPSSSKWIDELKNLLINPAGTSGTSGATGTAAGASPPPAPASATAQ